MNTEGRGCGSKTAAHSMVWAGVFINNPSGNGQTHGVFKNNSLKPDIASHNNSSWHTDIDRYLEHSLSWGSLYYKDPSLQKIIHFLRAPPPIFLGFVKLLSFVFFFFKSGYFCHHFFKYFFCSSLSFLL